MANPFNNQFKRSLFDEDHLAVKESFKRFLEKEAVPHAEQWEKDGIIPHEFFGKMGEQGYLCLPVDEQYGGAGIEDFRFSTALNEAALEFGLMSLATDMSLINDVALPYFLELTNDEQKQRWLPKMVIGEYVTAIAMTEPGGGSDLAALKTTAIWDGKAYVMNGSKTFITNGINADLVLVAARTDLEKRHGGISLFVIERGMDGFERGRNLDKVGGHGQDTAELFFSDLRVPKENLIGVENDGFRQMMFNLAQERLAIAASSLAYTQEAYRWTKEYIIERKVFGQSIASFQNSRLIMAEMRTELEIAQIFIDRCIMEHVNGELTSEQAAMAKWWITELQGRVMDRCVQLHGGYGYMNEYPIARAWADSRISRIYGGANEIMKEIIAKAEGLS